MQTGLQTAVGVPLSLATRANQLWDLLLELAHHGNINCKSDLQVIVGFCVPPRQLCFSIVPLR